MKFKARIFGKLVLFVAVAAALGGVVMMLWNAVVPIAFADGRSIGYLHALGLLVLSRILFGGFRGHGGWHGRAGWGRHWGRWQAMTSEEREQFQTRMQAGGARPCHRE